MNFQNRIALITGAASEKGIGREAARQLSSRGATVILADIDIEGLQYAAKEMEELGGQAYVVELNIADQHQIQKRVKEIIDQYGKIDILVNNAGISRSTRVLEITSEEWDLIFSVNMKGVFFLTQAVIPYMKKEGYGRIVNVASVAGKRGGGIFGGSHYAASKSGVTGFTKAVAREFAGFGITCNSVEPGLIGGTEITGGMLAEEKIVALVNDIPLGRVGTVSEVAYTIAFLATEQASYITGESLDINGGSHMD